MPSSSTDLLKRALAVQPSQAALARALGMNRSRLNRVFNGARLGIPNCLRLAALVDEPPHVVLRAWHYTIEADILERVYVAPRFTRTQVDVAERYARATAKQRRIIRAVLDEE